MRKANITYEPQGLTGFIVTLSFDEDSSITLSGQADGPDPHDSRNLPIHKKPSARRQLVGIRHTRKSCPTLALAGGAKRPL